jgi:hypothetical protein
MMQDELPDDFVGGIARTMLRIRDGEADGAEIEAFRKLLLENREARLAYLRANQLDCMLGMAESGFVAGTPMQIGIRRAFENRKPMALIGMAIAAAVALLIALWPEGLQQEPGITKQPVASPTTQEPLIASLTFAPDSVIHGRETDGTDVLGKGSYTFDRGVAEIVFASGARVVLEGPCSFGITDAMTMSLYHGKLWANCPAQAHGFEVLAPGGRSIVDLGTEFGIEATEAGALDVHVFDGMVDVVDETSRKRPLDAGQAISWTAGTGPPLFIEADLERFVTSTNVTEKRHEDYDDWMSRQSDLLLHFDFSQVQGEMIRNKASGAMEGTDGRVIGADRVGGRAPGVSALQFENPGDSVAFRLDAPKTLSAFTIAMWVKVDRIEGNYTALLNSDGWEPGDVHFQINRDGSLRSGINGLSSHVTGSGAVSKGQWQLLAVSWDLVSQTPTLSVNGRITSSWRDQKSEVKPAAPEHFFGKCRIATWTSPPKRFNGESRDLKARIDEVMVFRRAVGEEELTEIYENGHL